jgi:hypothetical protein
VRWLLQRITRVLARYTRQVDQSSHLEYAMPNTSLPTRARLADEVLIT